MEKILTFSMDEAHRGWTVKQILQRELGMTARQISRAKFLPDGIRVSRDGGSEKVTVRYLPEPGDVLTVKLEESSRASDQLVPLDGTPDIRYEDEDLLLVYKPAGMVVHPSPGHYGDSLANLLAGYYRNGPEGLVVRPVGRLDKDTSGLLFFAKNAAAAYRLEAQRKEGRMRRYYLALTEGVPEPETGTVEAPIGPVPGEWMRQEVRQDGASARTDYRVLAQGEAPETGRYSLVKLKLYTGRTHQIRVHMAHLGHPLLGDSLYGTAGSGGMTRTALHSYRIELEQPFTGEALVFEAEMPEDMGKLSPLQSRDL